MVGIVIRHKGRMPLRAASRDRRASWSPATTRDPVLFDTTGGCGGPQPARTISLRLNHPFLFVLREVKTGAILFMGRVLDPPKG